jgi:single-strand DNA-binding protein
MYQNLTLIGNLGTDPTMRYTPSGVAVADFTLAVNRSWTGQDGQQQNKTTWFKVSRNGDAISHQRTFSLGGGRD